MVRERGLEPPRPKRAPAPQADASTNSATRARRRYSLQVSVSDQSLKACTFGYTSSQFEKVVVLCFSNWVKIGC